MLGSIMNPCSAALLLVSAFGSGALAQTLPLRHGQFVVTSEKCADAPNAALLMWDGKGFSGAHSSACTSHVSRRSDGGYDVKTNCTALGDGTPAPAGSDVEVPMTLKVLSSTKFIVTKAAGGDMSYRWCSAKQAD